MDAVGAGPGNSQVRRVGHDGRRRPDGSGAADCDPSSPESDRGRSSWRQRGGPGERTFGGRDPGAPVGRNDDRGRSGRSAKNLGRSLDVDDEGQTATGRREAHRSGDRLNGSENRRVDRRLAPSAGTVGQNVWLPRVAVGDDGRRACCAHEAGLPVLGCGRSWRQWDLGPADAVLRLPSPSSPLRPPPAGWFPPGKQTRTRCGRRIRRRRHRGGRPWERLPTADSNWLHQVRSTTPVTRPRPS